MSKSTSDKPKSNKMAVIVVLGVIVLALGFTVRIVGQKLEQQSRDADRAMDSLVETSQDAGSTLDSWGN